jgi:hypothetical protein
MEHSEIIKNLKEWMKVLYPNTKLNDEYNGEINGHEYTTLYYDEFEIMFGFRSFDLLAMGWVYDFKTVDQLLDFIDYWNLAS